MKDDPKGLGRIVRDAAGQFLGIVEERDATPRQRAIREVNMSLYVFDAERLLFALDRLKNDNSQSEYYVTDCPAILREAGAELSLLAGALVERAGEKPIGFIGGVLALHPIIVAEIRRQLEGHEVRLLSADAALAAARLQAVGTSGWLGVLG